MTTEQIRARMGADATTEQALVMVELLEGRLPSEVSEQEWQEMIQSAVQIALNRS